MGCLQRVWHFIRGAFIFFVILLVIGFVVGDSGNKNTTAKQPIVTEPVTATVAHTATAKPTETQTAAPTKEPFEIILRYPELGEYGVYYTFNENVKKAEESDKNTVIQCFVPAGVYTVTNIDCSPWTFVYTYSKKTVITDAGWEEPADGWVSSMLKPGESCEVTIPEGWYIELLENDHFKMVLK